MYQVLKKNNHKMKFQQNNNNNNKIKILANNKNMI